MLKYVLPLVLVLSTPALAGQEIDVCNGCKITYQTTRVVKKVVRPAAVAVVPAQQLYTVQTIPAGIGIVSSAVEVPVAVPVRPAPVPVVPVYNYVPTPEASGIYSPPGYPTNVPVAAAGNCAMYVDPYDLFGQLFGGADLVQSCLVPAY